MVQVQIPDRKINRTLNVVFTNYANYKIKIIYYSKLCILRKKCTYLG